MNGNKIYECFFNTDFDYLDTMIFETDIIDSVLDNSTHFCTCNNRQHFRYFNPSQDDPGIITASHATSIELIRTISSS